MRRRQFITLLGGAATWPLAAHAQQPATPVVGFLNALGQNDRPNLLVAFRRGLGEAGYVDGRNVAIEYRFAESLFTTGGDPVQEGYVGSLNRPGSNVTGVSWFSNLVAGKGLGLLHELVPNAAIIALLVNPKLPETVRMEGEGREAARSLGQQLLVLNASTPSEIDTAFAAMRQRRVGALLVGADPFLSSRRQQIVA